MAPIKKIAPHLNEYLQEPDSVTYSITGMAIHDPVVVYNEFLQYVFTAGFSHIMCVLSVVTWHTILDKQHHLFHVVFVPPFCHRLAKWTVSPAIRTL